MAELYQRRSIAWLKSSREFRLRVRYIQWRITAVEQNGFCLQFFRFENSTDFDEPGHKSAANFFSVRTRLVALGMADSSYFLSSRNKLSHATYFLRHYISIYVYSSYSIPEDERGSEILCKSVRKWICTLIRIERFSDAFPQFKSIVIATSFSYKKTFWESLTLLLNNYQKPRKNHLKWFE